MFSEAARITRRRMLEAGSLGLAGLTLPALLRADAERRLTGIRARADACILVFLDGGPSHLDMWDMKPDAPAEIRGEFQPIDTSLAGVQFSEHLPRQASRAFPFLSQSAKTKSPTSKSAAKSSGGLITSLG